MYICKYIYTLLWQHIFAFFTIVILMGTAISNLHDYNAGFGNDLTKPTVNDWITKHAELVGLSIVEVERLWARFQQLGCNSDGVILDYQLKLLSVHKNGTLVAKILSTLAIDGKVFFHTFLNCMKWANDAPDDEKLIAIFSLIATEGKLRRQDLEQLLRTVYPDKDNSTISRYSQIVFSRLSPKSDGILTSEDFLSLCERQRPEMSKILQFTVIPNELLDNLETLNAQWASTPSLRQKDISGKTVVATESLQELSAHLNGADWIELARLFGYSDGEIAQITSNEANELQKAMAVLKAWKATEGNLASCDSLRQALYQIRPDLLPFVYGFNS